MAVQFTIAVTKGIIKNCKDCGNELHSAEKNCAVAFALVDIFPQVYVTNHFIFPFGIDSEKEKNIKIPLPIVAQQFIKLFDGFHLTPGLRLLLPEFEFTLDLTDEVIGHINIDEVSDFINERVKIKSF
jgi:hypothetical protein